MENKNEGLTLQTIIDEGPVSAKETIEEETTEEIAVDGVDNIMDEEEFNKLSEEINEVFDNADNKGIKVEDSVKIEETIEEESISNETEENPMAEAPIEITKDEEGSVKIETVLDDDSEDYIDESDLRIEMTDEERDAIKEKVSEKIVSFEKVDVSKYTIASKITKNPSSILSQLHTNSVFTWLFTGNEKPITMSAFSGTDLTNVLIDLEELDKPGSMTYIEQMFNTIYSHIVSAKPNSMTQWAKVTPFSELDNIYFCILGATYKDSNYTLNGCTNKDCQHKWMSDRYTMDQLYKVKDESKLKEILNKVVTKEDTIKIDTVAYQITNDLLFVLREPSIYSAFFEPQLLGTDIEKYNSLDMGTMMFIHGLFYIDKEHQQLIPINIKTDPDPNKNTRLKYKQFIKFLDMLTPDQRSELDSHIESIRVNTNKKAEFVTYMSPATVCPKCETTIKEDTEITAKNLLFIRSQLARMRN